MLVLVVLALVVLLGFAGLVLDIGRIYVAQRQLQQSVDAAALAAGQDLPDSVAPRLLPDDTNQDDATRAAGESRTDR